MLGNDRMETATTTSKPHRKSTWKTHRCFVDCESRMHVEISTSNRCHNFHVDLPDKLVGNLTNFPRGIWTSNGWWIHKDVSIGKLYGKWRRRFLKNKRKKYHSKTQLDKKKLIFWWCSLSSSFSFFLHCTSGSVRPT